MSDGIGAFLTGLNKGVLGSIYSGRRYYSPQTSFATASADLEKKELENVKAQKEFEDLQEIDRANNIVESSAFLNALGRNIKKGQLNMTAPLTTDDFDNPDGNNFVNRGTVNSLLTYFAQENNLVDKDINVELTPASNLSGLVKDSTGNQPEGYYLSTVNSQGDRGVITLDGTNSDDSQVVFRTKDQIVNYLNDSLNKASYKSDKYTNALAVSGIDLITNLGATSFPTEDDANRNSGKLGQLKGQIQAAVNQQTLDKDQKDKLANRLAFFRFEEEVTKKLGVLTDEDQREVIDAITQSPDTKSKFKVLTQIANSINRISTDPSNPVGETLKIPIPKINMKYIEDINPQLDPGEQEPVDQSITNPVAEAEKAARVKQIQGKRVGGLGVPFSITGRQPDDTIIDPSRENTITTYVDNIIDSESDNLKTVTTNREEAEKTFDALTKKINLTDRNIQAAQNILSKNNVNSANSVRQVFNTGSPSDKKNLIFAMAAIAKAKPEDADRIKNLFNTIATGDPFMTRKEAAEEDRAQKEEVRKQAEFERKQLDRSDSEKRIDDAFDKVIPAIANPDTYNPNLAAEGLNQISRTIYDLSRGGLKLKRGVTEDNQRQFINTVIIDLVRFDQQGKTDRGFFGNASQQFLDIFFDDTNIADGQRGDLTRYLRVAEKGKDGRVKEIDILDTEGEETLQSFTVEQLRSRYSPQIVAKLSEIAALNTNTPTN